MRASEKRKNNILIGVLLGVVVLMGIAYAAFASNLNITGTSSMSENWCIGFDSTRTSDYQAQAGIQGGTTPTGSMSFSGDSCGGNLKTTASLNATFKQPGDKVEYTLTIGNKGTLAAAIESIEVDGDSVTSDTTITKGNIKYIIEMPESTSLAVNDTTTMKITAMFQNDTDIEKFTGTETQTLSVQINAQQDDGNGGMVVTEPKFTGTIYRWSTVSALNGSTIKARTIYSITSDGVYGHGPAGDYDTLEACDADRNSKYGGSMECKQFEFDALEYTTNASTLNKYYYLKHDIVNDEIINSYVCFVYNNVEHCMKGGVNEYSSESKPIFDANTQIIKDYQIFYNLNTVSNPSSSNPGCYFDSGNSYCYGGGFYLVYASSDGRGVSVYGSSSEYCSVHNDGYSICYQ